ncbi:MAG: aminotransferase class I/II-fold pyridoxal phosphate-dependent enzyme [Desulfitobacteriaceae bacterium]
MPNLSEGLQNYLERGFRSFHTPGHKGKKEFFPGLDFPAWDLTELPGLDMLHSPQGIIAEAQRRAAQVFGAEESFFLINGGTVGNQAMLLGLGPVKGKILVERQAHRSVMAALVLTGLVPEYLPPVVHPEFNLALGLDEQKALRYLDKAEAWHFTYPSYYGTTPDLKFFLAERNERFPGVPILVDQAHGAHYLHDLFPPSALKLGADLVLQSTHKTLSALTQAAMLHVQGENVERARLKQALELLQSSSPSYLLIASLEQAGEFALNRERWDRLHDEVLKLYREVKGVRILTEADAGSFGIHRVDWSKILINTSPLGIPAPECVEQLRRDYRIEPELWDEENILFVIGIGNTPEDVRVLTAALQSLASQGLKSGSRQRVNHRRLELASYPFQRLSPREAFLAPKRQIRLKESLGLIAGESISPYPPGVPILVMGEEITVDILEALVISAIRWQGWEGFAEQMIWIVDEV